MAKPAKAVRPGADRQAVGTGRWFVPAAVIVLLTVAIYLPGMRGRFVWDDVIMVPENYLIHSSDGLRDFWFSTKAPDYWPLTNSSLWIEWQIWKTNTIAYHATNVLLHAASAVLLWLVLRRLSVPAAWLAALIFAVHPVNAASVEWIAERKNTLSLPFYLLTILAYFRFETEPRRRWYFLALAAFLLALLAKTSVVMLPFVLLGCVWWLHRRITIRDAFCVVPFFALSLAAGIVTVLFQLHRSIGTENIEFGSLISRMASAGWAVWFYLCKAFIPLHLSTIYPLSRINAESLGAFVPDALLVVLFVVLWLKRGSWGRPLLFGLGYFVVTLAPVLGFFKMYFVRYSIVADHWQYVSIIGIIALATGLLGYASRSWRRERQGLGVACAAVLVVTLSALTVSAIGAYKDEETLWKRTLRENPKTWLAQDWVGFILAEKGRAQEGICRLTEALRMAPNVARVHNNMGLALFRANRLEDGVVEFRKATELDPKLVRAHSNLGLACFRLNRLDESIAAYEKAVKLSPNDADLRNSLGGVLHTKGRVDDAIRQYRESLRINPQFPKPYYNLGRSLIAQGKVSEAIPCFREAIRLNPGDANAHFQLGYTLRRQGMTADAVVEFLEAIRLKPGLGEAHNDLGGAYFELGKVAEAADEFKKAVALMPENAAAWNNLGAAFQRLGKASEAAAALQEAKRRTP